MADCASASRKPARRTSAGVIERAAGKCSMNVLAAVTLPLRRSDRSALACLRRCSRFGRIRLLHVLVGYALPGDSEASFTPAGVYTVRMKKHAVVLRGPALSNTAR